MQYFWEQLEFLEPIIRKANKIHLFLDFDGTLSPIVSAPDKARLPKQTKRILGKLLLVNNIQMSVVSGRTLADIKQRVNTKGIIYAGSHGMEWEYKGQRHTIKVPSKTFHILQQVKQALQKISQDFPGTIVEEKIFSIVFHYRQVTTDTKQTLKEILKKALDKYIKKGDVALLLEKESYELWANVDWTKGDLINKFKSLFPNTDTIIYIGDSTTDEGAFKKLRNDITIKVGTPHNSMANYFLKDEKDVQKFLSRLLYILTNNNA